MKSELEWIEHTDRKETYFMLCNQRGTTIKKGEQIFYFYGRLTNAYLLIHYGFAYEGNRYDSVEINLEMKPSGFKP